jgi:hypothetical protein
MRDEAYKAQTSLGKVLQLSALWLHLNPMEVAPKMATATVSSREEKQRKRP